jgi:polysaccharide deacetylase 2 family uncharacterized protein YibQ
MKAFKALSASQKRNAIIGGVGLFAVIALLVWGMLWVNRVTTVQNRDAQATSVTVSLVEKKAEVPQSWQEEEKPAEPEAEVAVPAPAPKAMPPVVEQESQPEVKPVEEVPVTEKAPEPKPAEEAVQVTKPEEQQSPVAEMPAAPVQEQPVAEPSPVTPPVPPAALPLWQKYARPFDLADTRPRIALIITDMGMAAASTQAAIQDTPGAVTLAFSALAPNIEADMLKARAAGHEMLLAVPMEPDNYPQNDAGPNSLLVSLQDADNVARLNRSLSRSDGYVGIIPVMGEKFVTFEKKLAPVIDVLRKETLIAVDSTMVGASMIPPLARLVKIPFARADLLIDSAARGAIDDQLAMAEAMAQERGQVTIIVKPYPIIFEKLAAWIATLDAKNMILAPVSAVTSMSQPPAVDTVAPEDQAVAPAETVVVQ